jgi:site-specific recombinase XerD
MAERSKRIEMSDDVKIEKLNVKTVKYYNKYEVDMSIRELSPKTIYNYKTDLYQWFIYVLDNQGNQCITDLDEDDITEFIYWCKQQGNNTRRIKRRMSSISAFYKYLRKKRIISENPMEFIDRPKRDVDVITQTYLTAEQVVLMKEKLREYGDLQIEIYALLSLSTMGRVNAISNICWKQIDFKNRVIENVLEKEQRLVNLFFNEECKELLLTLKAKREAEGIVCDNIFITNYDGGYSRASVTTLTSWCKKTGNMIGLETLHPHDYRHSNAQLLKLSGCPIEIISELLNHSGLDVTKKFYLKQDTKLMKSEKDKYEL